MSNQEVFEKLKKFMFVPKTREIMDKEIADAYKEELDEECEIGAICYDIGAEQLECYIYVEYKKDVISCLLYKSFNNLKDAYHYFNYLKEMVLSKDLNKLLEECSK